MPVCMVGTGFAGFSLAMAVGRFSGDWARRQWNAPSVLRVGGLAADLAMTIASLAPGLTLSVFRSFLAVPAGRRV